MAGAKGLFLGDEAAVKATHIPIDFDEYINRLQSRAAGLTATDSPWYNAVIRKRAHGVVSIPRRITRIGGDDEIDEVLFDGNAGYPLINFPDIMQRGSIALDNYGAMYLAVVMPQRGEKPLAVRWLDPSTIRLDFDRTTGEFRAFERILNGVVRNRYEYDANRRKARGIAWAWTPGMNEMGPGDRLSRFCELPAGTLVMADELVKGLYQRGAINQHWVNSETVVSETEKERIREKIRRVLFGGVKNANNVEVFNAGLTVTKIGTDPNALELGPTADRLQNDICAVADTPRILLNTADASNRATIDRITQTWIISTIAPHAQLIVDALNYHVLHPIGYDLALNTAGLDVDQQEESEKANAWAVYVDRYVDPETAAAMLGLEIPDGMPFIDEGRRATEQAAQELRSMANVQAMAAARQDMATADRKTNELRRLQAYLTTGAYYERSFKSDILTTDEIAEVVTAHDWRQYP